MLSAEDPAEVSSLAQAEFADTRAEATANPSSDASVKPPAPSGWWVRGWEAGLSPFSIVRGLTVYGPSLISRYAARRFAEFDNGTQRDLFSYLYGISCVQRPHELADFIVERCADRASMQSRTCSRLELMRDGRSSGGCPRSTRRSHSSTDRRYVLSLRDATDEAHDWMDPNGGHAVIKALNAKAASAATEAQRRRSKVIINPNSGHWVRTRARWRSDASGPIRRLDVQPLDAARAPRCPRRSAWQALGVLIALRARPMHGSTIAAAHLAEPPPTRLLLSRSSVETCTLCTRLLDGVPFAALNF